MDKPKKTPKRTSKEEVLQTICEWDKPYVPTLQRVADRLDVSKTTVNYWVKRLRAEGCLEFEKGSHGLRVHAPKMNRAVMVPIVFDISAGDLIDERDEAVNSYHDDWLYLPVSGEQGYKWVNVFALKVVGDSMTGAGINDGDIVVIRRDRIPVQGDIIAARVKVKDKTQITLKSYYRNGDGSVTLQPANGAYTAKTYPEDQVMVAGVMVAVVPVYPSSDEVRYEPLYEEGGVTYKLPYKEVRLK